MATTEENLDRTGSIMEEGRGHVASRFDRYRVLQKHLWDARLEAREELPTGLALTPPAGGSPGAFLYDPAYIAGLAREHKHPEWIVCARLERLILDQIEQWDADEDERVGLAAHRDRYRARIHSVLKSRD